MAKFIGLTITRRDDWCLGFSLRVALSYCDAIVLLIHARPGEGIDGTMAVVNGLSPSERQRLHLIEHTSDTWDEMTARQLTLDTGRSLGGTHFAIIDSDEAITFNTLHAGTIFRGRRLVDHITDLKPGQLMSLRMICPWNGLTQYRHDGNFGAAIVPFAFADKPGACWRPDSDGYHFHQRTPRGIDQPHENHLYRDFGLMHFQYASIERLKAKAVHYKMLELLNNSKRMTHTGLNLKYDWTLRGIEQAQLAPMPSNYLADYGRSLTQHLRINEHPWQLDEIRRMVAEHGFTKFHGIDFHGIKVSTP